MSGHVGSVKTYFLMFFLLMVLTTLTVAVAFVNLGVFNTVIALAIAATKMVLVILFFMHVRESKALTKIVVIAGFLWLIILIVGVVSDYQTRNWTPSPTGWEASSQVAPVPHP